MSNFPGDYIAGTDSNDYTDDLERKMLIHRYMHSPVGSACLLPAPQVVHERASQRLSHALKVLRACRACVQRPRLCVHLLPAGQADRACERSQECRAAGLVALLMPRG